MSRSGRSGIYERGGLDPPRSRILIVDDNIDNLLLLRETLDDPGYDIDIAAGGEQALQLAREHPPSLILLDLRMPGIDGHETCRRLKADPKLREAPVLFISATDSIEARLAGFDAGAVDFLTKPFHPDEVTARVRTHLELARLTRELSERNRDLEREIEAAHAFRRERLAAMLAPLQGEGEAARRLRAQVEAAARAPEAVLLHGSIEDGSEAAARAIHEASDRRWCPFVKVRIHVPNAARDVAATLATNSGTLDLDASVPLADGGTLYLEGVESLTPAERRSVLQLIAEGEVRVIAQHEPSSDAFPGAPRGGWRTIELPSLADRREDIPAIVAWLLQHEADRLGRPVPALATEDLARMLDYPWPGGIAEIESVIRRAVLRSGVGQLEITHDLGKEERHLGRYRLQRMLGKGGMGEVWRARHELLPHPVAVKIIAPELAGSNRHLAKQRFSREAFAIARLQSPYTVRIYDFGSSEGGELYYAMELLEGLDLHVMIRAEGPLPVARTVHFLRQAASSLAEAHARGLVHRDIKPPNLIVSELGAEPDWLKVVDFGVVTVEGGRDDDRGLGTPGFVAPEIITGDGGPTAASDIYSLGCCAYWCLTAHEPFAGENTHKLMSAHASRAPPAPSLRVDIPAELDDLVLACLAKRPEDRPDAAALVDALEELGRRFPWTREDARRWWGERRSGVDEHAGPRAETLAMVYTDDTTRGS
jgi:DNA-binding NtrC family response regulator